MTLCLNLKNILNPEQILQAEGGMTSESFLPSATGPLFRWSFVSELLFKIWGCVFFFSGFLYGSGAKAP